MIHEATAVEDDLLDLFGKTALGDKFANFDGSRHIGAGGGVFGEGFLRGVNAGQCIPREIIDDLRGDVLAGEVNRKAGPLGGTGDFLAEAYVTQFAGICCGHGIMILRLLDSLAFFATDNFVGITDALALVWLGRIVRTDIGGHLADEMLIDSLN